MSKPQNGFTLIEILIVVLIIGIAASITILALGDFGQSRHVESTANTLAMIIPAAEQQALLTPTVMGFSLKDDGYQFYRFQAGAWKSLSKDSLFGFKAIPKDVQIKLIVERKLTLPTEDEQSEGPQLIILPSGDITPFTLNIGIKGEPPTFQITGEANGVITLKGTP